MSDVTVPISLLITGGGMVAGIAGAYQACKTQVAYLEATHARQSAEVRADIISLRAEMVKTNDELRKETISRREYDAWVAAISMQFKMILEGQQRIERRLDASADHQ